MAPLIEQHRDRIVELCKKYGITRLDVFGSAARGDDFDPGKSDVDFFYDIDETQPDLAGRFLDFIIEVEELLCRRVDMVSIPDMKKPLFLEVANRRRIELYAA